MLIGFTARNTTFSKPHYKWNIYLSIEIEVVADSFLAFLASRVWSFESSDSMVSRNLPKSMWLTPSTCWILSRLSVSFFGDDSLDCLGELGTPLKSLKMEFSQLLSLFLRGCADAFLTQFLMHFLGFNTQVMLAASALPCFIHEALRPGERVNEQPNN